MRAFNRIAKAVLVKRQLGFGPWTRIRYGLWRFYVTEYPRTASQRAPVVEGENP